MKMQARLCFVGLLTAVVLAGCGGGGGGSSAPGVATYTVGGTVSGLAGAGLVLQDNNSDDLTISENGAFTFATPVADGAGYHVTVLTQPAGQYCTASVNAGALAGANVANVAITCVASGSLDAAFGTDGKAITPIGADDYYESPIAIQSDGKIVAAVYSSNGTNLDFAVVRYNTDGSLDATFGTDGKATTPIGASNDFANAVAIQSDGKIVAAGYSYNGTNYDFAVVRYNTDGSLDAAFGTDGKAITPIGASYDYANAVAIQSDGKVVAAGYSYNGTNFDFAVVRYNTDGSLDAAFDQDGKATTPIGASEDFANAVAIQSDGKIVAAGSSYKGTNDDFAVVRYNKDGSLDPTFGTGGKATTPIGASEDAANAVAIQSDGKIVAAGSSFNGTNSDFAVVRYNTDGSLDAAFDQDGKATTPIGVSNDYANAVAIQSDGKIVAAGHSNTGTNGDFAVVRYNTDGSLDAAFDTDGKATTEIGGDYDKANSVAIQSDGKIVAAGYSYNGTNYDFAVVRYNP